jgi:hypothetical protein
LQILKLQPEPRVELPRASAQKAGSQATTKSLAALVQPVAVQTQVAQVDSLVAVTAKAQTAVTKTDDLRATSLTRPRAKRQQSLSRTVVTNTRALSATEFAVA